MKAGIYFPCLMMTRTTTIRYQNTDQRKILNNSNHQKDIIINTIKPANPLQ